MNGGGYDAAFGRTTRFISATTCSVLREHIKRKRGNGRIERPIR